MVLPSEPVIVKPEPESKVSVRRVVDCPGETSSSSASARRAAVMLALAAEAAILMPRTEVTLLGRRASLYRGIQLYR